MLQTANPVKVETDMGDESGSVEDVETTEVLRMWKDWWTDVCSECVLKCTMLK